MWLDKGAGKLVLAIGGCGWRISTLTKSTRELLGVDVCPRPPESRKEASKEVNEILRRHDISQSTAVRTISNMIHATIVS